MQYSMGTEASRHPNFIDKGSRSTAQACNKGIENDALAKILRFFKSRALALSDLRRSSKDIYLDLSLNGVCLVSSV